jgi:hypothetical protein
MKAAQKLDVQYVLPGHGPSGGKEILEGQREFMVALRAAVADAVKSGKAKDGKLAAAAIQLPASVKNWVGDGLQAQVQDAYNEIKQNKAAGDLPH